MQELFNINLKVNYIEGRNLNVTKTKLRVELQFQNSKPQSFTTKLEFSDETGRQYQIPISGTTDNSILTNYSYIQRSLNEFEIQAEEEQPIRIVRF